MTVPPDPEESRPADAPEPGDEGSDRPAVPPPPPPLDLPAPPPPGPLSPAPPPEPAPPPTVPPAATSTPPPAAPTPAPSAAEAEVEADRTQEITSVPPATTPAAPRPISAPPAAPEPAATPLWTPPAWNPNPPNPPPVPPGTQDWATGPAPASTPPPVDAAPPWTPVPPLPGPGQPDSSVPWPAPPGVPTKRKRGPLVAAIVLAAVLLCGGGGLAAFLFVQDAETGEGAAEPVAAVESFLDAVYVDQNPAAAAALVCRDARDQRAIEDKVDEVRRYARTYPSPRYRWDQPKVEQQDADKAVVSTRLTVLTADDRSAQQQLRFTLVHRTGWWVCDVG